MESASALVQEKKSYSNDTMWKPELDKTGNGFAVVRSYQHPKEKKCRVSYFDHGFQGLAVGTLRSL